MTRLVSVGLTKLLLSCLLASVVSGGASAQSDTSADSSADSLTDASIMYHQTDSVTSAIDKVLQEMFWRVRANDNTVFYENEYPHLRESMNIDTYLGGVRFRQIRQPNSDSIIAITTDSARVIGDTALAYVNLIIRSPGSDTTHSRVSAQRLYRLDNKWIRPLSTTPKSYEDYTRRIQRYEEDADSEDDN